MDKHINIIVAASLNDAIGMGGRMPWHLPADLAYFKRITSGHDVIMGRRTHESIGRPLPGRRNIVVSRRPDLQIAGCDVCASLDAAIQTASDGAFVIGGGEIYRQAWPLAWRIYLTRVQTWVDAYDASIPALSPDEWYKVETTCHAADERNAHDMAFEVWQRRLPAS